MRYAPSVEEETEENWQRALNTKANTKHPFFMTIPFPPPFFLFSTSCLLGKTFPWTHSALFAKSLDKQSLRSRLTGSISLEKRIELGVFKRSPRQLSFKLRSNVSFFSQLRDIRTLAKISSSSIYCLLYRWYAGRQGTAISWTTI